MSNSYMETPGVDRMGRILDAVAAHTDGVSASDLLQETRIAKSTLYRLLRSMTHHGFLSFHAATGLYTLGLRFIFAPLPASRWEESLRYSGGPLLQQLAMRTQESCKINTIFGTYSRTILAVEGPRPVRISLDPGALIPLHTGSSGKILMQDLTEEDIRWYFRFSEAAPGYLPRPAPSPEEMLASLRQVRQQGYASDLGEVVSEVSSLAVPIRSGKGVIVAALSVAFPTSSRHTVPVDDFVSLLHAAADELAAVCAPVRPHIGASVVSEGGWQPASVSFF